ncbi:sugar ABC transporter substrate-binding protein [Schaalia sp. ZJ1691]|uniref:ABC transporter substrate-binding protein n=1 Tax=Schaalia sp. ZJ1691 TaxID=2709404 RepID=UPI0013EC80D9|nr:sugar ABC transporter substrate-binding protein [Schaalia sp. ZJ1691]
MKSSRSITRLATCALAVAVVGSLTACGSGGMDTSKDAWDSKTPAASAEGVDDGAKLTMWTRAPLEKQAKNAVEAYNASHKNQIALEIIPNDDVEGKLGAAIQSGTLPDILAGDVVRIPYWVQQGVFADLTDRIDALPNKDDLQAGHIDAGTLDGTKHTLPFVTDISVMVWNKDLYKEAGLDPEAGPTTFGEFIDQAKAVAGLNKEGVAGTYIAGQSGGALVFTMMPTMWASGEEVLSEDGTEAMMNNKAAQKMWEGLRELAATENGIGSGSKEETGATWTAPFQEGKIGVMHFPFTSVSTLFEKSEFDIGVAGIPGIDGGQSTFLGGDAIGISQSSKNVDQAWNFMQWLMSDEVQQKVFADNNDTAASLSVLKNGYANADPRTLIANATIADGRVPVAVNFNEAFNAAGSPWQLLIQNAIWGDGSKVDQLNSDISTVLAQQ